MIYINIKYNCINKVNKESFISTLNINQLYLSLLNVIENNYNAM